MPFRIFSRLLFAPVICLALGGCLSAPAATPAGDLKPAEVNILLNIWLREKPALLEFYQGHVEPEERLLETAARIKEAERRFLTRVGGTALPAAEEVISAANMDYLLEQALALHFSEAATGGGAPALRGARAHLGAARLAELAFIREKLGEGVLETPFLDMEEIPEEPSTMLFRLEGAEPFTLEVLRQRAPSLTEEQIRLTGPLFFGALFSHLRRDALGREELRAAVLRLPETERLLTHLRHSAAAHRWREENIEIGELTDDQLQTYLEEHTDRFRRPPKVWAEVLEVSMPADGSVAPAGWNEAVAAAETLVTNGHSVEEIAASFGEGPLRHVHVTLKGDHPDAAGRLFSSLAPRAPVGSVEGPVVRRGMFLIYEVHRREVGEVPPLEELRDAVSRLLHEERYRLAWRAALEKHSVPDSGG